MWKWWLTEDNARLKIWDHNDDLVVDVENPIAPKISWGPFNIPDTPDARWEVYQYLIDRGKVDMYALKATIEALAAVGFEEGRVQ